MAIANGADFGRIDAQGVDRFYLATGDIENALYRMKMPHALSRFFALPDVDGSFLHSLGVSTVEGIPVDALHSYSPCMAAMPMGWSWAFYFCHKVLEQSALIHRA